MPKMMGLHDTEAYAALPHGCWQVHTVALSENPQGVAYFPDLFHLVRLNWGYGSTGTIPRLDQIRQYALAAASYASQCSNVHAFIIGNEPNHENERPDGVIITPQHYVECFIMTRDLLKQVNQKIRVIPAPCAPYHANPTNWLVYNAEILGRIAERGGCDELACHAYTRFQTPESVFSDAEMNPPLEGQYNSFRTYRDFLSIVPSALQKLPVHITEFDPEAGWKDENNGFIVAAQRELVAWNSDLKHQRVVSLTCYRFSGQDAGARWQMGNKPKVMDDFYAAVSESPQIEFLAENSSERFRLVLPTIKVPETSSTPLISPLDEDSKKNGVTIVKPTLSDGEWYWAVKNVEWLSPEESQGRHHIYFDILDEQGKRIVPATALIEWSTGSVGVQTENKPIPEASGNFPLSPGQNAFQISVLEPGGLPPLSERVKGLGMGAETPSGFNPGIHAGYRVTFQKKQYQKAANTQGNPTPTPVALVHPVYYHQTVPITQVFGVNEAYYKQFSVDGVPLKGHNGVDFGVPEGTVIQAVDAGKVIESGNDPAGFGIYVKLLHPWGETLYAHLSRSFVQLDLVVNKGQPLGYSGNTGNSSGPHLHFGLRTFPYVRTDGWGGYRDPLPFLPVDEEPLYTNVEILTAIKLAAERHRMEWQLLASLAWAESSFQLYIQDGLFQISQETWRDWSVQAGATDISDPFDSASVAAIYLKWLLSQTNGNIYKALTAYNFGIGNVLAGVKPPDITIQYVNKVIHGRDLLKAVGA